MDILFDFAIAFADCLVDFFEQFGNYAQRVAAASEVDSNVRAWLLPRTQEAACKIRKSRLKKTACVLTRITRTENRQIRLNALAVDAKNLKVWKVRLYFDVADVPRDLVETVSGDVKSVELKITEPFDESL